MAVMIDIRELPARLEEVLALVSAGQEIILVDGATPFARLVPCGQSGPRVPGLHAGAMQTTSDFDVPLPDDFRADQPFAGLWEHGQGADGSEIETCTIPTTEANELARPVHDRMPVILPVAAHAAWLDPKAQGAELQALLRPYPGDDLTVFPMSTRVNNPRHEGPKCVAPA